MVSFKRDSTAKTPSKEISPADSKALQRLDALSDIVLDLDQHANIIYINQRWQSLLHHEIDDCLGLSLKHYLHPDDEPHLQSLFDQSRLAATHLPPSTSSSAPDLACARLRLRNTQQQYIHFDASCLTGSFDNGVTLTLSKATIALHSVPQYQKTYLDVMMDQMIEGFAVARLDGTVEYTNKAWQLLHGYEADKDFSGSDYHIFRSDEAERINIDDLLAFFLKSGVYKGESKHKRKDGSEFIAEMTASLLYDDDNEPYAIIAFMRDITERKQSQQQLNESELRRVKQAQITDFILNSLPGIFYIFDQDGHFLRWNENFEKVLGYHSDAIGSMTLFDFVDTHSRSQLKSRVSTLFQEGKASFEARLLDANGQASTYLLTGHTLVLDGRICAVGMGQNIENHKRIESDLADRETSLRITLNSITNAVITIDSSGHISDMNPVAERMMGWRLSVVEGQLLSSTLSLYDEHGLSLFPNPVKNVLETQQAIDIAEPVLLKRPDGKDFFVSITASPMWRSENTISGVVLVMRNITESYRLEKMARKAKADAAVAAAENEAKSTFLANMSHEIRTPMSGVLGMNRLLMETVLTDEQAYYVNTIDRCGEGLLSLINDILDFSKIEAGKLLLENIDFNFHQFMEDFVERTRFQAIEKSLDFSCHIDDAVPVYLKGDSVRIGQILTNLVGNAFKFTQQGEVTITVDVKDTSLDAMELIFHVTDTGIGIEKSKRSTLFSSFSQADLSTTRQYGGTGLGLTISKQLAELMQGDIGFDDEYDDGTSLWFTIKLDFAEQDNLTDLIAHSDGQEEGGASHQSLDHLALNQDWLVLLVEDNIVNQQVALGVLTRLGVNVDIANNGQEALDALKLNKYDLIFMDCQMPVLDGFSATKEIRKIEQLSTEERTPIVAMTANAMKGDKERCLDAGMDDYLTKPISFDSVAHVLHEWISTADLH